MYLERFQTALAQSPNKPTCAKVNLPLWYALKRANLLQERSLPTDQGVLTGGLTVPFVGDTVVLLDPDIAGMDFLLIGNAAQVSLPHQTSSTKVPTSSPPHQRWMGRY